MMNVKETLKKLHKKYPVLDLDDLFEILDCYTEEPDYTHKPFIPFYGDSTTNTTDYSIQLKAPH